VLRWHKSAKALAEEALANAIRERTEALDLAARYCGERDNAIAERDAARKELESYKNPLYCSFCGKSQHEIKKLIAAPTVFICDECVEVCVRIIDKKSSEAEE